MHNFFKTYLRGDKGIWIISIALSLFSLLAVYSSKGQRSGPAESALIKQFVLVVFGLGIMFFSHHIKYTYFSRLSQILLFIAVPLLLAALIIGREGRWLSFGIGSFQPSDIAKIAVIMFTARTLAKNEDKIKERSTFWQVMIPALICCALIFPGNLSTSILLFTVVFCQMFVAKIKGRYLWQIVGAGVVGIILLFFLAFFVDTNKELPFRANTWASRIEAFIHPKESNKITQADEAKAAIASSSFIGKLPGNSIQRNFLRESHTDFIFAIILEEYGILGGLLIILCYLWFFYRIIIISLKCEGAFGSYIVLGIGLLIMLQALINMSVSVGLMPVTGQPLPLISSGGTSLIFTCMGIGIILSVSAENEKKNKEQKTAIAETA